MSNILFSTIAGYWQTANDWISGLSSSKPIVTTVGQSLVTQNPLAVTQAPKASYQTMKTFTGTLATSTSTATQVALYTVTAGKIFYITDMVVCNNASYPAQVSINASSTLGVSPIVIGHSLNTSPFDAINLGTEPSVASGLPVTFQSLATSTTTTLTYYIGGYEQ